MADSCRLLTVFIPEEFSMKSEAAWTPTDILELIVERKTVILSAAI
jgi:hypothetical protein